MTKAALPNYMQDHIKSPDIPPGHIFGLYFPVWQDNWTKADDKKTDALKKATTISAKTIEMAEALLKRQQAIALHQEHLGYFPAISTSPFMTGIGNEHPLENGFAFLNPYGLPYLPGSSVKGVLRSAAEELALGLYGETKGWDMLAVWWLFGFEADSPMISNKSYKIDVLDEEANRRRKALQNWINKADFDQDILINFINATVSNERDNENYQTHPEQFFAKLSNDISNQGAISFWDVYPQSKNLAMDILTPHHGGYLQGKNAPHDSEQPVPNVFLTIPPSSQFHFLTTCEIERLPNHLQQNWQLLMQAAFNHAFDWLGFGAKTAVGYGQMKKDENAEQSFIQLKHDNQQKAIADAKQKEAEEQLAKMPEIERQIIEMLKANKDPNKKNYLVLLDAVKTGSCRNEDKKTLLERIQSLMSNSGDWKPTTQKKDPSKDKEHIRTLEVLKLLEKL